jgi:hypothetical protein
MIGVNVFLPENLQQIDNAENHGRISTSQYVNTIQSELLGSLEMLSAREGGDSGVSKDRYYFSCEQMTAEPDKDAVQKTLERFAHSVTCYER